MNQEVLCMLNEERTLLDRNCGNVGHVKWALLVAENSH